MKKILWVFLLVSLSLVSGRRLRATEEQDLIATLQSNASAPSKSVACARLRIVGSKEAVPSLSSLLRDPATAHAARYALEGMSFPEAAAALRDAVGQTSGLVRAGLIDSLGWKRDESAVAVLSPLLADTDPAVAGAAARALGRIGNRAALSALRAMPDTASAELRLIAEQALLACADLLRQSSDDKTARELYADLFSHPATPEIRVAAWRGRVLAETDKRQTLVLAALLGPDRALEQTAEKLLAEVNDPTLVQACLGRWKDLGLSGQLAVLRACLRQGGDVLPTLMLATGSPHSTVRVAAWRALGDIEAPRAIPALANVAAGGEPTEKEAARETLARMPGKDINGAIEKALTSADVQSRSELLRAVGERGESDAGKLLLRFANANESPAVRLAALESLRQIAAPETLQPLLALMSTPGNDADSEPLSKALDAVCRNSPDKEQATRTLLAALPLAQGSQQQRLLGLLPELGTASALEAAESAMKDPTIEISKEAFRVLSRWPNAAPAGALLAVAQSQTNSALQILALRAAIEVSGHESNSARRLAYLRKALETASRPGEKKLALAQLGSLASHEAFGVIEPILKDPAVSEEAGLAAVNIAEKIALSDRDRAAAIAQTVLAVCKQPEVLSRAWKLRGQPGAGPFLREWLASGPYSKPGVTGALAVFEIPFAPEKSRGDVSWKAVPQSDGINLAGLFPGRESCVIYLRTTIISAEDSPAVLLLGSDDGVKAWLNGNVVHSNNVDRGDVPDQDVSVIELKKGRNDLMLKVTQGGAGWSFHARVVGVDGQPIPGLRCSTSD